MRDCHNLQHPVIMFATKFSRLRLTARQVADQKMPHVILRLTTKLFCLHPLSSSRSVAHKAALLFFHFLLSLPRALTSSQNFQPAIALFFSTVRRQVVLGWPTYKIIKLTKLPRKIVQSKEKMQDT